MTVKTRNNVRLRGSGKNTIVFAHGFGCDQNMWRLLAPSFLDRYQIVLFDHVGAGGSNIEAYDFEKYASLRGYATDLMEIVKEFGQGKVIFIGHSVSSMIGTLADVATPGLFAAHIMVAPSPCYMNDGDYVGGFEREDINSLLETLESNYLGWSSNMAPQIMGSPDRPELSEELENSFCRTDPEIAKQFARVTFLTDNRADVAQLTAPCLILQCNDDFIAPVAVGNYLQRVIPDAELTLIDNIGHCPHISAPSASLEAIEGFLQRKALL